jgi:hypothetical protein
LPWASRVTLRAFPDESGVLLSCPAGEPLVPVGSAAGVPLARKEIWCSLPKVTALFRRGGFPTTVTSSHCGRTYSLNFVSHPNREPPGVSLWSAESWAKPGQRNGSSQRRACRRHTDAYDGTAHAAYPRGALRWSAFCLQSVYDELSLGDEKGRDEAWRRREGRRVADSRHLKDDNISTR